MKSYQRLIAVCTLCCLLACVAFSPISASANTAVLPNEVMIGLGGASLAVPGALLPYIIAVVALYGLDAFGYGSGAQPINVIDLVVEKAEWLSGKLSAQTKNWAVAFAEYIKGTSIIKFPEHMINETNNTPDPNQNKKNWDPLLQFCVGFFGGMFLLDQVNLQKEEDLTVQQLTVANQQLAEISGQITNVQNNLAQANGFLSAMGSQLAKLRESVDLMSTRIRVLRNQMVKRLDFIKEGITTLRNQTVDHLDSVKNGVTTLREQTVDRLDSVKEGITTLRNQTVDGLDSVKNGVTTLRNQTVDSLDSVKEGVTTLRNQTVDRLDSVKNGVTTLREQTVDRLDSVKTTVSTFRSNFNTQIEPIINNSARTVELLEGQLTLGLAEVTASVNDLKTALVPSAGGSGGSGSGGNAGNTSESVKQGKGHLFAVFGETNGVLSEYGAGIMVAGLIFGEFANIPFFSKLLLASLAIGAVAVFLGIALDISSRDSAKRTATKMQKANKEGFNAGFKAGVMKAGGS